MIMKSKEKLFWPGDFLKETLKYFLVKDPKYEKFYLLPKVNRHQDDVLRRPFISNFGFYSETYSLLDYE